MAEARKRKIDETKKLKEQAAVFLKSLDASRDPTAAILRAKASAATQAPQTLSGWLKECQEDQKSYFSLLVGGMMGLFADTLTESVYAHGLVEIAGVVSAPKEFTPVDPTTARVLQSEEHANMPDACHVCLTGPPAFWEGTAGTVKHYLCRKCLLQRVGARKILTQQELAMKPIVDAFCLATQHKIPPSVLFTCWECGAVISAHVWAGYQYRFANGVRVSQRTFCAACVKNYMPAADQCSLCGLRELSCVKMKSIGLERLCDHCIRYVFATRFDSAQLVKLREERRGMIKPCTVSPANHPPYTEECTHCLKLDLQQKRQTKKAKKEQKRAENIRKRNEAQAGKAAKKPRTVIAGPVVVRTAAHGPPNQTRAAVNKEEDEDMEEDDDDDNTDQSSPSDL